MATTIERELSDIIRREIDLDPHTLVSITRVNVSEDRDHATVFVSIFPDAEQKKVLEMLGKSAGFLQHFLNKRISHNVVPRIFFKFDSDIKAEARVDELLEQAHRRDAHIATKDAPSAPLEKNAKE
jgi:ribosome-binding factor A